MPRISGEVALVGGRGDAGERDECGRVMLFQEFVRVFTQVEELGFAHGAAEDIELHEFPVTLLHAAHPGLRAAVVDPVDDVAHDGLFALEHGTEAQAFVARGRGDAGEIAEGGEHIEQVGVSLGARAGLNAGPLGDEGDAPRVLVEILFSLQAVAADRDAVVGGVKDVGVVELAHGCELGEDASDLDVDGLGAGEFAAELVADRALVATLPDAAHGDLVAKTGMAVRKGMGGQIVFGKGGLLGMRGRERRRVGVVGRAIFREESGLAVARVVRVREAKIDEKRITVLRGLAILEISEHLFAVPRATGFVSPAAFGGILAHGEKLVSRLVTVA